ncbi:unnamed protein product [Phytomonas sp. EM1]|nr:unnamed protein product [Phytomonas sp. EM1]|eukprot:CCW61985.1 unnamed protein product [Phytomonas sp. isolate EM1]
MILGDEPRDVNLRETSSILRHIELMQDPEGATFPADNVHNPQYRTVVANRHSSMFHAYRLNPLMSEAAVECIGTFLFALTVPLCLKYNPEMACIGIGFFFASLVFSFAYISGGHFNPIVATSMWLSMPPGERHNAFGGSRLVLYVLAQMVGGSLGTLCYVVLEGADSTLPNIEEGLPQLMRGFLAECIFMFLLCSAVLHTADRKLLSRAHFHGLAVGFTLVCSGLTCGPIPRGALNPTVGTPLFVLHLILGEGSVLKGGAGVFLDWVAGVVGAAAASFLYLTTQNAEEED